MKELISYAAIMLLLSNLLTACSKGGSGNVTPKQTNVYVFGNNGSTSIQNGGYWKNNVFTPVDGSFVTSSGYVSGTNIYLAGFQGNYSGYWKNGVFIELDSLRKNTSGDAIHTTPISVWVSGNDVYVLANMTWLTATNTYNFSPVYWKNGTPNAFTKGEGSGISYSIGGTAGVEANNVFVSGGDVYVSGTLYSIVNNQDVEVPKYWKNGVETTLAAAGDGASAGQIFVSGNDVYVAGEKGGYAGYWKNGVFTEITDKSQNASIDLIYVSGKDVYLAGRVGAAAVYWKNGFVAATLGSVSFTSIYVSGSDVYLSGNNGYNTAMYWKNGVPTYLTDGAATYGQAGSIFVTSN